MSIIIILLVLFPGKGTLWLFSFNSLKTKVIEDLSSGHKEK